MDTLASLRERIEQSLAHKVLHKVLEGKAREHFDHGWKSDCPCSICKYRRKYVYLQAASSTRCLREERRDLNRDLKRTILGKV